MFTVPLPFASSTYLPRFSRNSNMSEAEDSGNTRSLKRDRSVSLSKKHWRRGETTGGEEPGLGLAVVNSQSVVGPLSSTSHCFQSCDDLRTPSDMVVCKNRAYEA